MRYRYNKAAYEKLESVLAELFPDKSERLLEAIDELIEAYVDHAVEDLDDRINKRGIYDPNY